MICDPISPLNVKARLMAPLIHRLLLAKGQPSPLRQQEGLSGPSLCIFDCGAHAAWDAAIDLAIRIVRQHEHAQKTDGYEAIQAYSRALDRGVDLARDKPSLVLSDNAPEGRVIEVNLARILPTEARERIRKAMVSEAEKVTAREAAEADASEEAAAMKDAGGPSLLHVAEMARTLAAAMQFDHGVSAADALALAAHAQLMADHPMMSAKAEVGRDAPGYPNEHPIPDDKGSRDHRGRWGPIGGCGCRPCQTTRINF